MQRTHTDLLNHLAKEHNYKTYLEIGVQIPQNNFEKIICHEKVGVDPAVTGYSNIHPMESDMFFKLFGKDLKFDLIFIDGLHHADQAERDFENALNCLTPNGIIVLHDTMPKDEETTRVPRETKVWYGDVWKFAIKLPQYCRPFYSWNNCTVILPCMPHYSGKLPPIEWQYFQQNKNRLLRVKGEDKIFS